MQSFFFSNLKSFGATYSILVDACTCKQWNLRFVKTDVILQFVFKLLDPCVSFFLVCFLIWYVSSDDVFFRLHRQRFVGAANRWLASAPDVWKMNPCCRRYEKPTHLLSTCLLSIRGRGWVIWRWFYWSEMKNDVHVDLLAFFLQSLYLVFYHLICKTDTVLHLQRDKLTLTDCSVVLHQRSVILHQGLV